MQMIGEQQGIKEFTEPQLSCDDIDPSLLTMIASGITHAQAYFRGPYDGGAAFFLIQDPAYPVPQQPLVQRIAFTFPQALIALPISNHKQAWLDYLQHNGFKSQQDGDSLITYEDELPVLKASFDSLDRLVELTTVIG